MPSMLARSMVVLAISKLSGLNLRWFHWFAKVPEIPLSVRNSPKSLAPYIPFFLILMFDVYSYLSCYLMIAIYVN